MCLKTSPPDDTAEHCGHLDLARDQGVGEVLQLIVKPNLAPQIEVFCSKVACGPKSSAAVALFVDVFLFDLQKACGQQAANPLTRFGHRQEICRMAS